MPAENTWDDHNEFNEQNEFIERILRNELVENELAALFSMNRTSKMNVTNGTNELMATSVFASTSVTNT